jgi:CDP-glycerol glycerophosphotransferase (TagB/SpsB family)
MLSGNNLSYRKVFAESSLLVTDYSSVAFDFAYLRKPLLYCQFDYSEFREKHFQEGYFDYQRDGFGEIETNLEDTVCRIIEYMKNGCKLKDKYRIRIDSTFPFNDKNNCERVYNAIKAL